MGKKEQAPALAIDLCAHVRARRTTRHCPGSLTLRFPHTQIPSRSDSVQGGAEVCHRPGWSEILRGRAWASARGRRQVPEGMGVGATLGLPVASSAPSVMGIQGWLAYLALYCWLQDVGVEVRPRPQISTVSRAQAGRVLKRVGPAPHVKKLGRTR